MVVRGVDDLGPSRRGENIRLIIGIKIGHYLNGIVACR
jgi:hypothetical protein